MKPIPKHEFEADYPIVIGVDAVGLGPWFGPAVACALALRAGTDLPGVHDSKKVKKQSCAHLDAAAKVAQKGALAWALGEASVKEYDEHGPRVCEDLAMGRALSNLLSIYRLAEPALVLVDGKYPVTRELSAKAALLPQKALPKGDGLITAVAAASVVAKQNFDEQVIALSKKYPGYGLENHCGYGTPEHQAALIKLGVTPDHRYTARNYLKEQGIK